MKMNSFELYLQKISINENTRTTPFKCDKILFKQRYILKNVIFSDEVNFEKNTIQNTTKIYLRNGKTLLDKNMIKTKSMEVEKQPFEIVFLQKMWVIQSMCRKNQTREVTLILQQ